MKIIQIIHVTGRETFTQAMERAEKGIEETIIFGLGDDGLVYFWIPESREWHIYG